MEKLGSRIIIGAENSRGDQCSNLKQYQYLSPTQETGEILESERGTKDILNMSKKTNMFSPSIKGTRLYDAKTGTSRNV